MDAEEENHLPDNELVDAQSEIPARYGTINPVQVLMKPKDGNVPTRNDLVKEDMKK